MAYTQTDIDNLDRAIVEMGLGNRIGTVTVKDDTVRYADVTLDQLVKLRGIVAAHVVTSSPRSYARNGGRG